MLKNWLILRLNSPVAFQIKVDLKSTVISRLKFTIAFEIKVVSKISQKPQFLITDWSSYLHTPFYSITSTLLQICINQPCQLQFGCLLLRSRSHCRNYFLYWQSSLKITCLYRYPLTLLQCCLSRIQSNQYVLAMLENSVHITNPDVKEWLINQPKLNEIEFCHEFHVPVVTGTWQTQFHLVFAGLLVTL